MSNETRSRLESLINTFFYSVDIDKFYSENQKEKLVNWLLENGVILPPCKKGDVVYDFFDEQGFYHITELIVDDVVVGINPPRCTVYCKRKPHYPSESYKDKDFGKVLFFSRKQAEDFERGRG